MKHVRSIPFGGSHVACGEQFGQLGGLPSESLPSGNRRSGEGEGCVSAWGGEPASLGWSYLIPCSVFDSLAERKCLRSRTDIKWATALEFDLWQEKGGRNMS